jgi:dolichyl-phosphate beta-glucosyltransferase
MTQLRLSVVVPALNEAARLPPTLAEVNAYLAVRPEWLPAEIIVVDDGSGDETVAASRAVPPADGIVLRVAEHGANRGKGAAVRTGFTLAGGDWVLLSDADLSAPIEELETLWQAASPHSVVVGSRAVARRLVETPQPRHRDLMGRNFNFLIRGLGLTALHDTQCGFKLFPGNLARSLAAVQRLDGFAFDVELLLLARRWSFDVREIGVRWRHVEASRVLAVRHSSQMLRDVIRLWWWRATGALAQPPETPQ